MFGHPLNYTAIAFLLFACNGDKEDTDSNTDDTGIPVENLNIMGNWVDNWGGAHSITDTDWISGESLFIISSHDNESSFLIAQNDAANEWNANMWSKFEWFWDGNGDLRYCQTAFDAESEDEAVAAIGSDRSDLESGCSGHTWSILRIDVDISGSYEDPWGVSHTIGAFAWHSNESVFHVTEANNDDGWLVAQNDSDNEWSADLWSQFEWLWTADGDLFYCQTVYNAETEEGALDDSADRDDLEAGCGGSMWSPLREALNISGAYTDDWGSSHTVSSFSWMMDDSLFHVSMLDNDSEMLIAQNDSGNAWSADLWSKFEWHWDSDAALRYCQTVFDAESESSAVDADCADRADMEIGCCGNPWSILTEVE